MLYLGCKQLYEFVVRKNCLENDLEYCISRDSHNHTRYTKKSTNNQSDNKYLQRTGFHRVGEYNRLTKNIIYKLSKEETYQYIEGFWKDNTLQVGIHKIGDSEHKRNVIIKTVKRAPAVNRPNRINDEIRVKEVRLIDQEGEQVGIVLIQ